MAERELSRAGMELAYGDCTTPSQIAERTKYLTQMDKWELPVGFFTNPRETDVLDQASSVGDMLRATRHADLADGLGSLDRIERVQAIALALKRGISPQMIATRAMAAALLMVQQEFESAQDLAYSHKLTRSDAFKVVKKLDDDARDNSRRRNAERDGGRGGR